MHPHPGTPNQRKQRILQGRSLKGSRDKIDSDRSPKAPDLFKFPKHESKNPNKIPNTQKHSFEKNTAGWRGPWAAPLLWRVAPGDLGTEEPKLPHQGNRPWKRNSIQDSETELGPQRTFCHLAPSESRQQERQLADKTGP